VSGGSPWDRWLRVQLQRRLGLHRLQGVVVPSSAADCPSVCAASWGLHERGTLLAVRGISLSFKGVRAITDLSFDVRAGEICALIGPNGAGKSSLLNILNGVYRADAGELVFDGAGCPRAPLEAARRGIGRTFQNNALFKKMSVLDNISPACRASPAAPWSSRRWACRGPGARQRPSRRRSRTCSSSSSCSPGAMCRWAAALRPAEAGGAGAGADRRAAPAAARRADGRHERRGEARDEPLHRRHQPRPSAPRWC
jgi:hypothetical protein